MALSRSDIQQYLTELLLIEDIEAVRKQFPKIEDDDFDRLIRLDPTFKENRDSVGTYGKWILNLFNKGNLKQEDEYKVPQYLSEFEEKKKGLKNKDIGQFKTLPDLAQALREVGDVELTHRQQVRQNQKARKNADLGNEAELVYEDDTWEVWIPKTYAASCKLGQGSSWCTATTEDDYYYNHYSYEGPLYIIINKNNPKEKYQFHFPSGQFMDIDDRGIAIGSFFDKNEGLKHFFIPIILKDFNIPFNGDLNEVLELTLDEKDVDYIFADVENSYYHNTISGDTVCKILFDPYELFANADFYVSFDDIVSNLHYYGISVPVKEELIRLGVLEGEASDISEKDVINVLENLYDQDNDYYYDIEQAFENAFRYASEAGTETEMFDDVMDSIKSVFPTATFDGDLHISIPIEQIAIDIIETIDEDTGFYDDGVLSIIRAIMGDKFTCTEPYYGWQGFDEEAFQEYLAEELSNIGD